LVDMLKMLKKILLCEKFVFQTTCLRTMINFNENSYI